MPRKLNKDKFIKVRVSTEFLRCMELFQKEHTQFSKNSSKMYRILILESAMDRSSIVLFDTLESEYAKQ